MSVRRRWGVLAVVAILTGGCSDGDHAAAPPRTWPGPGTTGVPAGSALTPLDGDRTLLATPGQVVDGKDVTGCLITASHVILRRCDIHGTGSGLHMTNNVVIEENWVHDLREGKDSHNDAVLTNGGANLVVRGNRLENPHTQMAVVALYGDVAPVVDVVVEDNLLDGGGYTVYGGSVAGKPHSARASVEP